MTRFSMRTIILLVILSVIVNSYGFPTEDQSQVIVAESAPTTPKAVNIETTVENESLKPKILSMDIETNVTARYATTLVTSKVANPNRKAKEVTFSIIIPETAFITEFNMELEGKVYKAYVKEKEEAKKVYQEAVSSGVGAAHVEARDSNHFTVSVNVEPMSKAIFRLTYEELLSRKLGYYNLITNINPGQLLDHLNVRVNINETSPISSLLVPNLKSANEIDPDPTNTKNPYAVFSISEDKLSAYVKFSPDKTQQQELMKIFKEKETATTPPPYFQETSEVVDNEGVNGQFVVHYDVNRTQNGDILINDGYFVHFFAPENLKTLKKHVIFVLDVSGSMIGHKIEQLKSAMKSILDDLDEGDYFNILTFSYSVKVYNLQDRTKDAVYNLHHYEYYFADEPVTTQMSPEVPPPPSLATKENIEKAKNIIDELRAEGGTNIYDALVTALKVSNFALDITSNKPNKSQDPEPMIIFLTDGDATVGETDAQKIKEAVKTANNDKTAIFSLAFGEDADRNFLKKISLQNRGFMRHIYEAADAAEQLKNFYKYIASPLLSNVSYTYPKDQIDVESVSSKDNSIYFCGSELILMGKMKSDHLNDAIKITGISRDGPIDFIPIPPVEAKRTKFFPLERMWAYLTIKQLLDKKDALDDQSQNSTKEISDKVLNIALKYSFVTPLTSLVVVKPNSSSAVNAEEVGANGGPIGMRIDGYALPLSLSAPNRIVGYSRSYISYSSHKWGEIEIHRNSRNHPITKYKAGRVISAIDISSASIDNQMSFSSQSMTVAYLNHPSAEYSDTIDRLDNVPVSRIPGNAWVGMAGVPGLPGVSANAMQTPISDIQYSYMPLSPEKDIGIAYTTTVPPIYTTKRVETHDTEETVKDELPMEDSKLVSYGLQKLPWIAEYINETSDTLTIPITNSTIVSYKLINVQKNVKVEQPDDIPCTNGLADNSKGICKYLTDCNDLDITVTNIETLIKVHCDANGYVGICCKIEVP